MRSASLVGALRRSLGPSKSCRAHSARASLTAAQRAHPVAASPATAVPCPLGCCHAPRGPPPAAAAASAAAARAAPSARARPFPSSSSPSPPYVHTRGFHASRPCALAADKPKRDFYEVLGVGKGADKKEIKKAYYKAAKGCHPDTNTDNPAAAEQFAELTGAYEVLKDDGQRGRYDQYGHQGVDPNFGNQGGGGGPFGGMNAEDIFGGAFSNMFNQQGRQQQRAGPRRGGDVQVRMTLPFMEAVNGTTAEIDIATQARCGECEATGCKPGTSPSICPDCKGSGQVTVAQGFFHMQSVCGRCGGAGQVIAEPCGGCRGRKFQSKNRTVQVDVPAGVDDGVSLRLVGEGHQGEKNAPAGNLYVELRVAGDPFFQRDGPHVHTEIPISLGQAVLGDTLTIPSLAGEVELQVPAGTQPDTQLVMRNRGIRKINSAARGHQYIHLKVVVPRELSDEARDLMERLAAIEVAERAQGKEGPGAQFERAAENAAVRVKAALAAKKKEGN
jgi:molecular chaperone DnaJ